MNRERSSYSNPGQERMRKSWTGTIYFLYSTETRNFTIRGPGLGSGLKFSGRGIPGLDCVPRVKQIRDSVPGTENFPRQSPGPVPNLIIARNG